ncbi:morphogenic membrane protein MmpA [Streptomyces sp. SD15]
MTTHRSPKPAATASQPVERVVMAALVLSVIAGLAWIGGMIYTVLGWPL